MIKTIIFFYPSIQIAKPETEVSKRFALCNSVQNWMETTYAIICGRTDIIGLLEQLETQQNYIIRNTIRLDRRAGPRTDQRKKRSQVAAHGDYIRQE